MRNKKRYNGVGKAIVFDRGEPGREQEKFVFGKIEEGRWKVKT